MEVVSGDQNSGQVSVTSLRPCDRLHQSRPGKKRPFCTVSSERAGFLQNLPVEGGFFLCV